MADSAQQQHNQATDRDPVILVVEDEIVVRTVVAAYLRDLGIEKGDRVAVWMLNSHEYLELYFATAIAGIVIVPINTRWHVSDVDFALADSGAKALFVDQSFASKVE